MTILYFIIPKISKELVLRKGGSVMQLSNVKTKRFLIIMARIKEIIVQERKEITVISEEIQI